MDERTIQRKKDLFILDFDGTVYYNVVNNFTINIKQDNIIDAHTFFREFIKQIGMIDYNNIHFMLITGRNIEQQYIILDSLRLKGYRIDNAIFINIHNVDFSNTLESFDENLFYIYYWDDKSNHFRIKLA